MYSLPINNLIPITNNTYVLCNPNLNELLQNNDSNLSIIYFTEFFKNDNPIIPLLENNLINNVLIISNQKNNFKHEKVSSCSHINSNILNSITNKILIIMDINDNYNFLKFIIKNFKKLIDFSLKLNINLYSSYNNSSIICSINNTSTYFYDVLNCIKTILISNVTKQYEFIYDTVCEFLDNQFCNNNLCDFKNDQCISNRSNCSAQNEMGCCYSFDYAGFFDPRVVKNVKLCKYMKNRTCTTKNITCKLFTCKYLKKKNIKFNTHKILLLDCFFNKKQHDIIQSNFFKTREDILQKLLEDNHDLYYWYILRQKYRIK